MGRPANTTYTLRHKGDAYFFRYSYDGIRYYDEPTGESDARLAHEVAAQAVAQIHAGTYTRHRDRGRAVPGAATNALALPDLIATWLVDFRELHPHSNTWKVWRVYSRRWLTQFKRPHARVATLADITTDSEFAFIKARMKIVLRDTVVKERSALRVFMSWCVENRYLARESLPRFDPIPRSWSGKASEKPCAALRKKETVPLSREEVYRLIANLPERSRSRGSRSPVEPNVVARIKKLHARGQTFEDIAITLNDEGVTGARNGQWFRSSVRDVALGINRRTKNPKTWIVRDRVIVLYETGLRPVTIARLTAPTHYRKGQGRLKITKDIDKARFDREVPLSAAAREALDRCVPELGPIFGHHDIKTYLREAATAAGIDAYRALWVAGYDLRHARATHLLEAGASLPGVAQLGGWKRVTTLNRYVNLQEAQAAEAIRLVDVSGKASPKPKPKGGVVGKNCWEATAEAARVTPTKMSKPRKKKPVRRRGLEPLRFYPLAPQASASANSATFASGSA